MKKHIRLLSLLLVIGMIFGEIPFFALPAAAQEPDRKGCKQVPVGNGYVSNIGYPEESDLMANFGEIKVPGFTMDADRCQKRNFGYIEMKRGEECEFYVTTADNEILSALAQPGSGAQYRVWFRCRCEKDFHEGTVHNDYYVTHVNVQEKKSETSWKTVKSGRAECDKKERWKNFDTDWLSFEGIEKLYIDVWCDDTCGKCGSPAAAEIKLFIKDETAPAMTDYTFNTNGTVNNENGKNELFIKLGTKAEDDPDQRYAAASLLSDEKNPNVQNFIDMKVSFSEPVGTQSSMDKSNKRDVNVPGAETEKNALDTAVKAYDEAVKARTPESKALAAAEEALNEVKGCDTILAKALNAIIAAGSEGSTNTIAEKIGQTNTQQIEVEQDNGTKTIETVTSDAFIDAVYEAAGISTEADNSGNMPKTFSDEDMGYLRAAAPAIEQAQKDGGNVVKAAFDAIMAAKVNVTVYDDATDTDKQEVRCLSDAVKTALTAEMAKTDATVESCTKAMCDAREAEAQAVYNTAKSAYDVKDAAVTAADETVHEKQQLYNNKIDELQAKAERGIPDEKWSTILKHQLFNNTLGTGYIRMGLPCYMELYKGQSINGGGYSDYVISKYSYTGGKNAGVNGIGILERWNKSLSFRYAAQRGDFSGNTEIKKGGGITTGNDYEDTGLLEQLKAILYDAAGNPLQVIDTTNGSNIFDSSKSVKTNTARDKNGNVVSVGGLNVIVDAEPPTYTRTGNGITPDILTRVVLNKNDSLDFIVSFSEATITKRAFGNGDSKTYLLLNNGDRAYFSKKSADEKQWYFHYKLKDVEEETETTQWLAIALCNDALNSKLTGETGALEARKNIAKHSVDADGRTITDYVGNILADRANEDFLTNDKQIESSTAWAQISIDNTAPVITFNYNSYNAGLTSPTGSEDGEASRWGQAGKVYVNANDPKIRTPEYTPDQTEAYRPGSGIFRPDNATAASESASTAKGLFYYIWSQDPTPPDAGVNYEVIKRYSLAGWDQTAVTEMREKSADPENENYSPYATWNELYEKGLRLSSANNYSEIVPPEMLLTPENSGVWYLHVWTADMSWDSARQLMQYELMYDLQYKDGYRPASALELKMSMIEKNFRANNQSKDSTYTYDNAKAAIRDIYYHGGTLKELNESGVLQNVTYGGVYTDNYWNLMNASGKMSTSVDDAEVYARNETMKMVGDYGNIGIWTWEMYRNEDSNWTQKTAEIRFDNTCPVVTVDFSQAVGNKTGSVKLPIGVSDADSGIIDKDGIYDVEEYDVYYQWIKKTEDAGDVRPESTKTLKEVDWIKAGLESDGSDDILFAVTAGNVFDDGEYYLSVRAIDLAGNETVYHSEETVTVNSQVNIACDFGQIEDEAEYYRSVTPTVRVTELKVGRLLYAVTGSASRPADAAFAKIASCGENDTEFDRFYQLPVLDENKTDGTWYVHVLVWEEKPEETEPFYFYHEYSLDNTDPILYLSPSAGGLEKDEYSVTVTAADALSGIDADTLCYQWTMSETAPAEDAEGWTSIVSGTAAQKKITEPAESGNYYLHVMVKDTAGNMTVMTGGAFAFKVSGAVADYSSRLLFTTEEDSDLYGIAELVLDTEDKSGYRYSFSSDGGEHWSSWVPYGSMAKVRLNVDGSVQPEDLAGMLYVKFRNADGVVGAQQPVSVDTMGTDDGLWAVMTLESLSERKSDLPLTLLVEAPKGVTVEADKEKALYAVKDKDNDFVVEENGLYSFILSDGENTKEYDIVVDVYDNKEPVGAVTYSTIVPTALNVTATLETSEPVYVTEIIVLEDENGNPVLNESGQPVKKSGRQTYTFTENGKVRFCFHDAAGNENTAIAEVKNIDHSAPDVEIAVLYSNGKGKTYVTKTTEEGKTISQGLFLSVVKTSGGNQKNFTIVSGDRSGFIEVTENGTYSFIVQDELGNARTVSKTIDGIAEPVVVNPVSYRYEKDENAEKNPGDFYLNDNVVAAVSIVKPNDGRAIYLGKTYVSGATPLDMNEEGTCYILSHTYQANGETGLWFNDGLGGTMYVPIVITGIDKTKPTLTLSKEKVILKLEDGETLSGDELIEALGGYIVSDRETPSDMLTVTVCNADPERSAVSFGSNATGVYTVRYYIVDRAGNESYTDQTVHVVSANDMYFETDGIPLLNSGNNTVILDTNEVRFTVGLDELQQMFYRGKRAYNRSMRYDIYYTTGLYREGQMKYIATKLTGEELGNQTFILTFEKTGWYTIVIRNQERSRIYTSFFVSSIK